ncbi:MAG: IclR family transcriptional regulator [Micromonosporaceae bacterium]
MVERTYRITALERGLKVLATFGPQRRALGPSEVSRLTGIPVSTAYRILRTLQDSGYLEQLDNGDFTPGVAVLKLGFAALQNDGVVEAARGPLHELYVETGETVNLAVLSGAHVLYLLRYKTAHYVIGNVSVGATLPATCTGLGKTLLSTLSADELDRTLAQVDLGASGVGPNAHRDPDELRRDLAITAERGWGMQDQEVAYGLRSIAVPVRSLEGVVAAVGVSVEGARWPTQRMIDELVGPLTTAAQKISVRLGYLEGVTPAR